MNKTNTYNKQTIMPQGQTMPQQVPMQNRAPRGWRERWMHRFGMDTAVAPLRKGELTIPNWVSGKSMAFYFVAMFACWGVFGHVPEFALWITACISAVLFFYGGGVMARGWSHSGERQFIKSVYITGLIIRLLWILYLYFIFNPEFYGVPVGSRADVEWYMPFGQEIARWITGESELTFLQMLDAYHSAIDDVGYPLWLGIIYAIFGLENEVLIPFVVKCIVGAYCAVCIYHIAKRHFGEGTARIAAIFVCVNPNMIYWCGTMMKEAEMVFLVCLAIDLIDKALSSGKQLTIKSLVPGVAVGFYLFFFRSALGLIVFLAIFAHIVMASGRVMSLGKKVLAGILVAMTLFVGVGDRLRSQTQSMIDSAQSDQQARNMEWRSTRKDGGNTFAKYASAAVFAPLIFTIPFPTFNQAEAGQLLHVQLSGGSYIKNVLSFFVILVMFMMLISGEWRRHVFILAYTVGYLAILVVSSYAQSGRFHMPIWPMLMLFAAYGIQIAKTNARIRKWFPIVLMLEVLACLAWNWFKLKGRGMI